MSKSKINLLITSSVMSAVCLAGMSNVSLAVDMQATDSNLNSLTAVVGQSNNSMVAPLNAQGQRRYIVRFKEAAVARYSGNGQHAAIPRRADNKIEVNSPAVTSYVNHLKQQQNTFLTDLSSQFGRQVDALLSYQYAINGMAVELTAEEAALVQQKDVVANIEADRNYTLDTDAGPTLIGANNVWNGMAPASGTAHGEGVVIGTLDTGMNFDHPSFADVGGDGYDHTNPLGSGNYLGVCDPSNLDQYIDTYVCNDKVIGGFDFINALVPDDGSFDIPGPEDENGHGSHTASTSGGNVVLDAAANGVTGIEISGVAPHANVIHFDICFNSVSPGGCAGSATVASIDQILADGIVDVVNYSISGGTNPWSGAVELAFLSATDSGVFVSASAGNAGPGPGTLGHLEPWTSSVGASTHNRDFESLLSIVGQAPPLADIAWNTSNGPDIGVLLDIPTGINSSTNVDAANFEGCNPFSPGSFTGQVALISRGSCSFNAKVLNAEAGNAVGVIIYNNAPGAINMDVGVDTTIPSISIFQVDGQAIVDFLAGPAPNGGPQVLISSPVLVTDAQADVMAGFSSRGPSPFEYNKPDVTGPGVNILAAFNDDTVVPGVGDEYGVISGTSMSSPHNAGTAALLKELHPTWTVPEIKSALMLTSVTAGVTKEDGVTPADPFDRGAGRIQVDVASSTGLVMNETAFRFLLADPSDGGDPKTLNTASYKNNNCVGTCSFQRKFRSVAAGPVTYNASLSGMTGTVNPATFTANPGQTITIDVDIDGAALVPGATSFGELQIVAVPTLTPADFVLGAPIVIDDNDYDLGDPLTDMNCANIAVSGISGSSFTAQIEMGVNHTWVDDLTFKLVNPNGDELTFMNDVGDSSDLVETSPITFVDGAAISAVDMGDTIPGAGVICQDDSECEFAPAPNGEPEPPSTFADLGVGTPNGDWTLCGGDTAGGDAGSIQTATLTVLESVSAAPAMHMPLVVIGFPEAPEIDVTPTSLASTINTGETVDLNLNIANLDTAGLPLNWMIDTAATSNLVDEVYYEQVLTGTGAGIVSDVFVDGITDPGAYSADSFTLAADTDVDGFLFEGFVSGGVTNLSDEISAFTVTVYADAAGLPAGNPEDGGGTELYTVTVPVGDYSLDLGDEMGNVGVNVKNASGSTWTMVAGTYWVTAYAHFTGANRWNWFTGVPGDGLLAQLIDPQDLFGAGFTDWTDLVSITGGDVDYSGLAFNMKSLIGCDASWISYSSTSGSVAIGADEDVTVTLDSTGVAPGVYEGAVCVASDDIDEPMVVVPVTLTVDGPSDLIFADGFEGVAP
ncbi:MAG: S8 family serine peptidase [Marinicella sp.]